MLVLGSGFQKQGGGKIIYYACMFLVASDSKAAVAKRVLLYILTQGILDPQAMPCRVVVGGSLSHSWFGLHVGSRSVGCSIIAAVSIPRGPTTAFDAHG